MTVCLAVTCHDPSGAFEPGVRLAGDALRGTFAAVAVNATSETSPATMTALQAEIEPLTSRRHRAGSVGIGTARRDALALALETDCASIAYSDLDHVLRWATSNARELELATTTPSNPSRAVHKRGTHHSHIPTRGGGCGRLHSRCDLSQRSC